jgi:hypothetical protein
MRSLDGRPAVSHRLREAGVRPGGGATGATKKGDRSDVLWYIGRLPSAETDLI